MKCEIEGMSLVLLQDIVVLLEKEYKHIDVKFVPKENKVVLTD